MSKHVLIYALLLLLVIALISVSSFQSKAVVSNANSILMDGTQLPSYIQATQSADATATFGADLFTQQLTARAEEENRP